MTRMRLALRAKASKSPYICTPGSPNTVSIPWRSRLSTIASPPVMRGIVLVPPCIVRGFGTPTRSLIGESVERKRLAGHIEQRHHPRPPRRHHHDMDVRSSARLRHRPDGAEGVAAVRPH